MQDDFINSGRMFHDILLDSRKVLCLKLCVFMAVLGAVGDSRTFVKLIAEDTEVKCSQLSTGRTN